MDIDICAYPHHVIGNRYGACVWPLGVPIIVPPVNGLLTAPEGWKQPGSWGCWRAHLRVWEDMLSSGDPWAVILEGDAIARESREELTTRLWAYIRALPPDCDIAYFGGQCLGQDITVPVGPDMFRRPNINRTHAYMVFNNARTKAAYHRLCTMLPAAHDRAHIDYVLCDLQKAGALTSYIPGKWFFGQRAGESTVELNNRQREERWWDWR